MLRARQTESRERSSEGEDGERVRDRESQSRQIGAPQADDRGFYCAAARRTCEEGTNSKGAQEYTAQHTQQICMRNQRAHQGGKTKGRNQPVAGVGGGRT